MKKNFKLFMVIFSLMLIVAVVVSFSWFYNLDSVSIDSANNMNVQVGSNLEIAVHGSDIWGDKLTLNKDISVIDCSGNGVTFYNPAQLDEHNQPVGDLRLVADDQLASFVIDTYVDIRTSNTLDLYLGSQSFITPIAGEEVEVSTDGTSGEASTVNNQASPFGDYLTGNIAGSVRVAFFEVTYEGETPVVPAEPIFVWAPNSKFEYNEAANSFTSSGTRETEYTYYKSGSELYTYTREDILGGKFVLAEGSGLCTADSAAAFGVNHSPRLLSFAPQNGFEVKHLLIRVWFEGTDREANYVFNNGKVDYNFSFAGITPKTAEHTAESIDALKTLEFYKNGESYRLQHRNADNTTADYTAGAFIWSVNGIDWETVGANKDFSADTAENGVYIALAETANATVGTTLGEDMILLTAENNG